MGAVLHLRIRSRFGSSRPGCLKRQASLDAMANVGGTGVDAGTYVPVAVVWGQTMVLMLVLVRAVRVRGRGAPRGVLARGL